jgi:hypothetical protein
MRRQSIVNYTLTNSLRKEAMPLLISSVAGRARNVTVLPDFVNYIALLSITATNTLAAGTLDRQVDTRTHQEART